VGGLWGRPLFFGPPFAGPERGRRDARRRSGFRLEVAASVPKSEKLTKVVLIMVNAGFFMGRRQLITAIRKTALDET
jgi:hypothetical protein